MDCDFLVIGAGMAGASAACELLTLVGERGASVVVLEREDTPGYHSTGRSAALYSETYGNAVIRMLSRASRAFLEAPPPGFADHPVLTPRGLLYAARADQQPAAERLFEECSGMTPGVRLLDSTQIKALSPVLQPGYGAAAVFEPAAMDIDVNAIHQGFLRGFGARGGTLVTGAGIRALERRNGRWLVETGAGSFSAETVVNAAGAWADEVASLAGVEPLGLQPKRRTVITFEPPTGARMDTWPLVVDIDETFYFRPEAGRVLASPADETPVAPCDAQPDELDVATAVDRIERATTLRVARIVNKWAGLRSFFADKTPAVGPDADAPGFFWLAGQGGYGIQTAPAMARLAAALATAGEVPPDLADAGLTAADVSPARLRH